LVDTYYMMFSISIGNNKNKQDNIKNNNGIQYNGKYYKTEPVFLLRKK
jgi:hypothetical protein